MIVSYIRSSSYSNYDYCEMNYFLTYVLGFQSPSGKRAQMGTVVHKVMECLAACKKELQDSDKKRLSVNDDAIGEIKFTPKNLYEDKIVSDLLKRAYDHYTSKCEHHYTKADFKFCDELVKTCLTYNNGQFDPRNQNILCPEASFDLPIEEPWANFEYTNKEGQLIKGQLAIKGTIDLVTKIEDDIIEVIDYKGLPLETKLPTPSGWTTMGEVEVGDILYDKDGNETKVTGKSQVKFKDCFKIVFDDTSEAECDDEHIWLLSDGREVEIKDLKVGDKIDVAKPIKCDEAQLPIDPYVLGLWLGDGRNKNGEICGMDSFVFDEIQKRGYQIGGDISGKGETSTCPSHTVYGLVTKLKSLNLLNNKHIPEIYLRASYQQRLDLVRGLMDSDGYANKIRKQGHFANCNENLSRGLKELLLSLGQRPYLVKLKKEGFGLTVDSYDIFFRPININPFLLPRKADAIDKEWGPGRSDKRTVKEIIKTEKKYTQCIMVDSPSRTYLCTENMIPTHNTGQRKNWATGEVKTYDKLMDDAQLLLYNYAITKIFPDYKQSIMTIFFIRDGGPFSMCFDKSDQDKFLKKLENRFYEIQNNKNPKPLSPNRSDFRCTRLCYFHKNNWPGTNQTMCRYVENKIKTEGYDKTVEDCTKPGFDMNFYSAPG